MRLNLPRRTKRRVPHRLPQPLVALATLNGVWALEFMHDTLYGGRRLRTLNVRDEANREALAIEVAASIPASRVLRVLEQLLTIYGRPRLPLALLRQQRVVGSTRMRALFGASSGAS